MENQKKERNILEKITFYLGLFILALLIGYLVYQLQTNEEQPPSLQIITSYESAMPQYTFKVEVQNKGQETAKSANINLNLYQNGKLAESAVLGIDYVPAHSKEKGWVTFSKKRKASDSLVVGPVTFIKP